MTTSLIAIVKIHLLQRNNHVPYLFEEKADSICPFLNEVEITMAFNILKICCGERPGGDVNIDIS